MAKHVVHRALELGGPPGSLEIPPEPGDPFGPTPLEIPPSPDEPLEPGQPQPEFPASPEPVGPNAPPELPD